MDEFNNNDSNNSNLYGESGQNFNNQPNNGTQFGDSQNTYGGTQFGDSQNTYGGTQFAGNSNAYAGQTQYYPNMQQQENKGFSITSLVCGVLGLIACFINGILALILDIVAIVFGALGRKRGGKALGTAGMICGIVGLILYCLCILLVMIVGLSAFGALMQ